MSLRSWRRAKLSGDAHEKFAGLLLIEAEILGDMNEPAPRIAAEQVIDADISTKRLRKRLALGTGALCVGLEILEILERGKAVVDFGLALGDGLLDFRRKLVPCSLCRDGP
jgi:hypothetical protein